MIKGKKSRYSQSTVERSCRRDCMGPINETVLNSILSGTLTAFFKC